MTRISARRTRRPRPGSVLAALAITTAMTAAPVTAVASTGTGPGQAAGLTQAFEAGRHIPGSVIGGIRPGTLHAGTAGGTEWAIASFIPSASASGQAMTGFQDGAATGVFKMMRNGRGDSPEPGPMAAARGCPPR